MKYAGQNIISEFSNSQDRFKVVLSQSGVDNDRFLYLQVSTPDGGPIEGKFLIHAYISNTVPDGTMPFLSGIFNVASDQTVVIGNSAAQLNAESNPLCFPTLYMTQEDSGRLEFEISNALTNPEQLYLIAWIEDIAMSVLPFTLRTS